MKLHTFLLSCVLSILVTAALNGNVIDDFITANEADLITQTATVNALNSLFGTTLEAAASKLIIAIAAKTYATYLTKNAGIGGVTPTSEQATILNDQVNELYNLQNRCADKALTISPLQEGLQTYLEQTATIDITQSAATVGSIINEAKSNIYCIKTTTDIINSAGVGNPVGGSTNFPDPSNANFTWNTLYTAAIDSLTTPPLTKTEWDFIFLRGVPSAPNTFITSDDWNAIYNANKLTNLTAALGSLSWSDVTTTAPSEEITQAAWDSIYTAYIAPKKNHLFSQTQWDVIYNSGLTSPIRTILSQSLWAEVFAKGISNSGLSSLSSGDWTAEHTDHVSNDSESVTILAKAWWNTLYTNCIAVDPENTITVAQWNAIFTSGATIGLDGALSSEEWSALFTNAILPSSLNPLTLEQWNILYNQPAATPGSRPITLSQWNSIYTNSIQHNLEYNTIFDSSDWADIYNSGTLATLEDSVSSNDWQSIYTTIQASLFSNHATRSQWDTLYNSAPPSNYFAPSDWLLVYDTLVNDSRSVDATAAKSRDAWLGFYGSSRGHYGGLIAGQVIYIDNGTWLYWYDVNTASSISTLLTLNQWNAFYREPQSDILSALATKQWDDLYNNPISTSSNGVITLTQWNTILTNVVDSDFKTLLSNASWNAIYNNLVRADISQASTGISPELWHSFYVSGVGSHLGIVTTDEFSDSFATERSRATAALNAALALHIFATDYNALVAELNAVPAQDSDDIVDYDTAYLAAQNAIDDAAVTVLADLATASNYINALAANDQAPSNQIDTIADASNRLKITLTGFTNYVTSLRAKVATARKEVAARILERELLFTAVSFTDRQTLKNAISQVLTAKTSTDAALNSSVAATTTSLSRPPVQFQSIPATPAPIGERSNMGVIIDAQVAAFNTKLASTLRQLFTGMPNQTLITAILDTLSPATYLQQTSSVMSDWLKTRAATLTNPQGLPDTFTNLINGYHTEWNEFVAILNNIIEHPSISSSAHAGVLNAMNAAAFTGLFESPINGSSFALKANTLNKLPSGSIHQIGAQGDVEFQRLIISMLDQIQKGTVTSPATMLTNAATIAAQTLAVPDEPTATVDSTSSLTQQLADGSTLLVTGTGTLTARLRDPVFNSSVTNKLSASLKIFLNNSARVGLGTANISNTPGQTPNVLGGSDASDPSSVQVVPDGNCFIDVNSDLTIGGSKPIVPTAQFGTADHTITFYSEVPRTITVLTNTVWDLSDFGSTGTEYVDYGKKIVFAGKVHLVLEPGARIRFPMVAPEYLAQTVVLSFTDNAQLICQGNPLYIGDPWTDSVITGTDCQRNKMFGMGEVWFDKNAQMLINKPALFSIEADYITPKTDITFDLAGASQIAIGSRALAGGAFQIGNMFYGGSKLHPHSTDPDTTFPNNSANPLYGDEETPFTPHATTIDFTLNLTSSNCSFVIGKQGFLGFSAGVINKDGLPLSSTFGPNGDPDIAHSAWQLQRLYNVSNISININKGTFYHDIITDGDSSDCSMFAISKPANAYPNSKYLLSLGTLGQASIHGGGNLYFIDKNASMILNSDGTVDASPHTVSLTNASYELSFINSNEGVYAPLASTPTIMNRGFAIQGISDYLLFGRGVITSTKTTPYAFAGPAEEFYAALRMVQYNDIVERFVPIAWLATTPMITYINNQGIIRTPLNSLSLRDGDPTDAIPVGYIRGEKQYNGAPTRFSMPLQ